VDFSGNCRKWAQFRYYCSKTGPEKVDSLNAEGKLCRLFLWRAPEQSGFDDSIRRMQCDQKSNGCRSRLDFRSSKFNTTRTFSSAFFIPLSAVFKRQIAHDKNRLAIGFYSRAFAQFRQSPGSVTRCFSSFPTSILNPALLPPASIHPIPLH